MTLGTLLGVICLVMGIVTLVTDEHILMAANTWVLFSIAFVLLGGPVIWRRR
jgi:hypothetical protein